jgi:tetratricopeptide (TPR) repeat protein
MPDGGLLIHLFGALSLYLASRLTADQQFALLTEVLGSYAAEKKLDQLIDWIQGGKHEKAAQATLKAAFEAADDCFADNCGDPMLRQAIRTLPLSEIPSLEKLAAALPQTLDETKLRAALRRRFADDWRNALSAAQLDHASDVYLRCLDVPLAAKCGQLLPTIFRKLDRIEDAAERIEDGVADVQASQERVEVGLADIGAGLRRIESKYINASDLDQVGLPRHWTPPEPPTPTVTMIGRRAEFDEVAKLLQPGQQAAITAAVQGLPGVGKTLLTEHLALLLAPRFPGGVLFERLGVSFRRPEQANPILNQWGAYAFGGQPLKDGVQLTPDAVRALLAGHGGLLIVLDDVWDLSAVKPLRNALPREACLLITTRHERLARDLDGALYPLHVLNEDDGLALLRDRAPRATEAEADLLKTLAKALGYHAMALDLAGRSLDRRRSRADWPGVVQQIIQRVREGGGFGELPFPGQEEQRVKAVEATLVTSYDDLSETAHGRFRTLGAFAPDASFRIEAAALMWKCSPEEAEGQLVDFAERGLLNRLESEATEARWQQHSLLRAYALALLRRTNEDDEARKSHASAYNSLMRAADDQQVHFVMLPDYLQLQYAFAWAIEHELDLAQALAGNTANLQAAFGFVRDNHAWASRLVDRARGVNDEGALGAALGTLGNALSRVATLPNERRGNRLYEALAAYDEALKYRRPDTAPLDYAMTQNNRAVLLRDLAGLPGEDRRARLGEALRCAHEAVTYYEHYQHAVYLPIAIKTLTAFIEARQRAESEKTLEAWQAVVQAGQTLLEHPDAAQLPISPETLRAELASCWNQIGVILSDEQKKPTEALAAFQGAARLQPDFAMWHRYVAGTHTDLGQFAEAEAAIARAAQLEPEHPRLADLRQELEEARKKAAKE